MDNPFTQIFAAVLALVLLTLYAVAAMTMALDVFFTCSDILNCGADATKVAEVKSGYPLGYIYVVTTVGGLVSALVVVKLGTTKPGEIPTLSGTAPVTRRGRISNNTLVAVYLLTWALVGLTCLVVGVMLHPDVMSTVSDIGTVWLGLAVSSGYAYFGIDRSGDEERALRLQADTARSNLQALEAHIRNQKIRFERPSLENELLGRTTGAGVHEDLQKVVLHLADKVKTHIRISSILRDGGKHGQGKAVDVGNQDVAEEILDDILPLVGSLKIDEIIFDAKVAGKQDPNHWNHDRGKPHAYDAETLAKHQDHVHFAVI